MSWREGEEAIQHWLQMRLEDRHGWQGVRSEPPAAGQGERVLGSRSRGQLGATGAGNR
jgi:hypothetical protein